MSSTTVGRLLNGLGYRLRSVRKSREGTQHTDRNAQFEHINATAARFLAQGEPVVSVDTNYDPSGIMSTGSSASVGPVRVDGGASAPVIRHQYT